MPKPTIKKKFIEDQILWIDKYGDVFTKEEETKKGEVLPTK